MAMYQPISRHGPLQPAGPRAASRGTANRVVQGDLEVGGGGADEDLVGAGVDLPAVRGYVVVGEFAAGDGDDHAQIFRAL